MLVHHAAAHGDGELHDALEHAGKLQSADAARGEREVDGAAAINHLNRGSGRRSYTVTLKPRFASRMANNDPASPAPMMLTPAAELKLKQFP